MILTAPDFERIESDWVYTRCGVYRTPCSSSPLVTPVAAE